MRAVYIDCFTSLDDIKGKDEGNLQLVLRTIMKAGGRFSIFDATRTQRMASTMTAIEGSGWTLRDEQRSAYPWVYLKLTPAGENALSSQQGGAKE